MLSLKFAEGFVDLSLRTRQFDSELGRVRRDMARFPGNITVQMALNPTAFQRGMVGVRAELAKIKTFPVQIRVDRAQFASSMALVRQQMAGMGRRSFGTVPIRADLRPWRTAMKSVAMDLYRVRRFAQIPIKSTGLPATHANLNLLIAQLRTAQALSKFKFTGTGGGGIFRAGGGSRGGGGSGMGGGFVSGLGQGLGMPFATSPAMMAGVTVGGGAAGAIRTAAGLQTQTAELRRVSGMSAEQAETHKQGLFDLGMKQPGVSIQDLMEISQIGGRAGVAEREGPEGLLTFTGQLASVKNAIGDMPTEELASSMIKVLNVFELGTDRVASFGSALTAMDNVSVASAKDILDITSRLSGTAQAIGMTLPQITAFSSVLKDVGLSNEVAGSSFSQILRLMATDSANFAAQIGVDAQVFADAYRRDPMEALGMVIAKFREMTDTIEGQEFLAELGLKGVRTTGSLQQLATKFDLVSERAQLASEETSTLNALIDANNLKADTLANAYQKLANAMTALADAMGAAFLESATAATNAITGFVKTLAAGDMSLLSKTLALSVGPARNAEGQSKVEQRFELENWFMKNVLGNDPAEAAKPISREPKGGAPLPAKNPGEMGPPKPPVADLNIMPAIQAPGRLLGGLMEAGQVGSNLFGLAGRAIPELAKMVPEKEKIQYRSGLSGEEVGRKLQDDVLNMTKDNSAEETAKNTRKANELLGELKEILKSGGSGVKAAVLGQ